MQYMMLLETQNYIQQYISIGGTILGTLLGWLIKDIDDNSGTIIFNIETFEVMKSNINQCAYNLKLFICNDTRKTIHIRNMKMEFYNDKKLIYEGVPRLNSNYKNYRKIREKEEVGIISLRCFEARELILCDLFEPDNVTDLDNITKIILSYENQKRKKKNITKKISGGDIQKYSNGNAFPESE